MSINLQTLVLNSHYVPKSIIPLSTISAEDAIRRVLDNTAELICTYDREILTPSRHDLKWPSIIANKNNYRYMTSVRLNRRNLVIRDNFKCQYCSTTVTYQDMQIDHVMPRSKKGRHSWENVVTSCGYCNAKKADSLPFGKWKPIRTPFEPTIYQIIDVRKKHPITIDDSQWLQFLPEWESEVIIKK